jgi:hypothetical protein
MPNREPQSPEAQSLVRRKRAHLGHDSGAGCPLKGRETIVAPRGWRRKRDGG